jgi:hypothetical protein
MKKCYSQFKFYDGGIQRLTNGKCNTLRINVYKNIKNDQKCSLLNGIIIHNML